MVRSENLRLGKSSDAINVLILFDIKILDIIETGIHILPELQLALGQGVQGRGVCSSRYLVIRESVAGIQDYQQANAASPIEKSHGAVTSNEEESQNSS